ncbi:MAG: NADH-quinone oxidoreductase subunit H [Proteobacteria bacterium]|nr:NADH-quinone oxidoreductase subunit H [Pseudomonadota bacterium]
MGMIQALALQGIQGLLVIALAPLVTGVVRKTKARLLLRRGASIFQPYRDLLRLFRKESVLAHNASWLFQAAPYLVLAFTWVAAALIPVLAFNLPLGPGADFIAIVGLLGSARFVLALAGLDVGTSFGGIGSSREVMIASVGEPAMLMLIFSLALVAGSTQLSVIAAFTQSPAVGLRISLGLALLGFIMVAIAENGRIPIDNPATHLELTMVHEAMVLEYSGRHLALIELSTFLKLLAYLSLIASVFLPWGIPPTWAGGMQLASALGLFLAKVLGGAVLLAFFEVSIAKMRVFRVPQFIGAALMLALLAGLLRLVSQSF